MRKGGRRRRLLPGGKGQDHPAHRKGRWGKGGEEGFLGLGGIE